MESRVTFPRTPTPYLGKEGDRVGSRGGPLFPERRDLLRDTLTRGTERPENRGEKVI